MGRRVHFSNWRNKEFLCETDLIMVSRNSRALLKNNKNKGVSCSPIQLQTLTEL